MPPVSRALDDSFVFLREWRKEDKEWKTATDVRLGRLETRNIANDAIAAQTTADAAAAAASVLREAALASSAAIVQTAKDAAAAVAESKAASDKADSRWRIGLIATIAASAILGILNFLANLHVIA